MQGQINELLAVQVQLGPELGEILVDQPEGELIVAGWHRGVAQPPLARLTVGGAKRQERGAQPKPLFRKFCRAGKPMMARS